MLAEAVVVVMTPRPLSAPVREQPCNAVSTDEKYQELWVCLCAQVSGFSTGRMEGEGWGGGNMMPRCLWLGNIQMH